MELSRLKELRLKNNISGVEIANHLNISPQYYYDLEKGKRRLNVELAEKIASYYETTVDYLLGRTDIRNPAGEIAEVIKDDPELSDFFNILREREDLKLLFRQSMKLEPGEIRQIIRIIKAIEDEEGNIGQDKN